MISVFELLKIGIGPSSSHTVGPMKAAASFADGLAEAGLLDRTARLRVDLFGSLAWTGKGHGTDKVVLGLAGARPETIDPDEADEIVAGVASARTLALAGRHKIGFDPATDIVFDGAGSAPRHPNTLAFTATDMSGEVLRTERWCSVGGGFVVPEESVGAVETAPPVVPYPFTSAATLLRMGEESGLTIAEMVAANEYALRPAAEVNQYLDRVAEAMMACIERGMQAEGELPGGLKVRRRARMIYDRLRNDLVSNTAAPHQAMDMVSVFAIAVNEENAAGGRVVTAPTNGASGVVPAVLRYYREMCPTGQANAQADATRTFLLTATAIGALFKMNASISGAEVGCQGEVGVACSMAAAGLAAVLGGTNVQIENAAEIGMEHHLGMTCDPVGGLVQIPCIERNAFGAMKAITAASLALRGDGTHHISLDQVIATMRQTGADMMSKYKETSQGGLAVNLTEC
jgi:L-serine dehydratase